MSKEHGHSHGPGGVHSHTADNIKTALILNLTFTVVEIIGGVWTGSFAILADAVHDLGDSVTLSFSFIMERVSRRERDQRYSYGYRRFSLLGALVSAVVLSGGSLYILAESVQRLMDPVSPNEKGMIAFALLGILANGLALLRLSRDSSLNARMAALHLLEDVLGWVGILIVAVILVFYDIPILDPILSIVISFWVLFNVIRNTKRTLAILLQAVPEEVDVQDVESRISQIEGVVSSHHSHVWSIDGEHHSITTHVVVPDESGRDDLIRIKEKTKKLLKDMHFISFTVEFEFESEECAAE